MRITSKMFYERFLSDLAKNTESIYRSHEQMTTGNRVNRPSDDPTAVSKIVGYETEISSFDEYTRTMDTARTYLDAIDSGLGTLSSILARAKELALQGASETIDANSRKLIAKEVSMLKEAVIDIANTRVGDRYLFAGYRSNAVPVDSATGAVMTDANAVELQIASDVMIGINITAGSVFNDATPLAAYGGAGFDTDNDRYVLRALNFLSESLENNDLPRIRQSLDHIDSVMNTVHLAIGEVGARLNRVDAEESLGADGKYNSQVYLSRLRDADLAKSVSDMQERLTALQALRTISSDFLKTNLFDFIR